MSAAAKIWSGHVPAPFVAIPQEILDRQGILTPLQTVTYLQLLRLSWGWHTDRCTIGLDGLANRVGVGRTTIRKAVRSIETLGLVEIEETTERGTSYKVNLPRDLPLWSTSPDRGLEEVPKSAPPRDIPVKSAPQGVQDLSGGGVDPAPIKQPDLKPRDPNNTRAHARVIEPVCVEDGPVLSPSDLGPKELGGRSLPLAGLPASALAAAYHVADAWAVLRTILTLIVCYMSKKVSIASPVAMLTWALKSPSFVQLEDAQVVEALKIGLKAWRTWMDPEDQVSFFYLAEIESYEAWLGRQPKDIPLKALWESWTTQCPATSKRYSLVYMVALPPRLRIEY